MRILLLLCVIALWLVANLAGILAGVCYGCSWLFDRLGDLCLSIRSSLCSAIRAYKDAA